MSAIDPPYVKPASQNAFEPGQVSFVPDRVVRSVMPASTTGFTCFLDMEQLNSAVVSITGGGGSVSASFVGSNDLRNWSAIPYRSPFPSIGIYGATNFNPTQGIQNVYGIEKSFRFIAINLSSNSATVPTAFVLAGSQRTLFTRNPETFASAWSYASATGGIVTSGDTTIAALNGNLNAYIDSIDISNNSATGTEVSLTTSGHVVVWRQYIPPNTTFGGTFTKTWPNKALRVAGAMLFNVATSSAAIFVNASGNYGP